MENVDACIEQIILNEFKSGDCFDTHKVIKILKENYHDAYTQDFPKDWTEGLYHAQIAQCIKRSKYVESAGRSKSNNINENITECELWRKL